MLLPPPQFVNIAKLSRQRKLLCAFHSKCCNKHRKPSECQTESQQRSPGYMVAMPAFGFRLPAVSSWLPAHGKPSSQLCPVQRQDQAIWGDWEQRTKDHGPIQEWPHAEPLTLGQKQWENTAEAHNKLLIYGSAFGHKKHAVFIVFNQLEKIWQSL